MKKYFLRLLTAVLVLTLFVFSALAQPRFPDKQGRITDAAAVLSTAVHTDLNKAAEKLSKATGVNLLIVTVDFLDGVTVQSYVEGLYQHWALEDSDALLLLAVGEDQFTLHGGKELGRKLAASTQQKLLSAHLQAPFMAQDYDGALRAFVPALIAECAKAWDKTINLGGLLGTPETTASPLDAQAWLQRRVEQITQGATRRVTDEDKATGLSLGKIILTLILLRIIFGKKGRRFRRSGCGCLPFSSILAALGLWKIWRKD